MRINQINIYKVLIPFSGDFSHALRKGASASNIVVEMIADQGKIKGYGESAPREYVTGETQESIIDQARRYIHKVKGMLTEAGIDIGKTYEIQLSHHYGFDRFKDYGATIIDLINREYCKKLIIQFKFRQIESLKQTAHSTGTGIAVTHIA